MTKLDGRFGTVIRSGVRRSFFKEKKKGKLINDLLEQHYKQQSQLDRELKQSILEEAANN